MPGFVATFSNVVLCAHGGRGSPVPPAARVFIRGQPVVTTGHSYVIAGCSLAAASSQPCVTGTFLTGATRVMTSFSGTLFPLLVAPNMGSCKPTLPPTLRPLIAAPAGQAWVYAT